MSNNHKQPLSLEQSRLISLREKIALAKQQFLPQQVGNTNMVIRAKISRFKPEDFATLQNKSMYASEVLMKRFYEFNRHQEPLAYKYFKQPRYSSEGSFYIFQYYVRFRIEIRMGDDDLNHPARIYYIDRDNQAHHLATAYIRAQFFMNTTTIKTRLDTLINSRKFRMAVHQIDNTIPQ